MDNNFKIEAVPTTFLVDSEGNLLGEPIIGSRNAKQWQKIIDEYLD